MYTEFVLFFNITAVVFSKNEDHLKQFYRKVLNLQGSVNFFNQKQFKGHTSF